MIKIRYNPYAVFASNPSPLGIYARKKWLNQEQTPQWKVDFQIAAETLLAQQSPDGSWQGSTVETTRRLFDLHLTIRETNRSIEAALDWLSERALGVSRDRPLPDENLSDQLLHSLPFTPGRFDLFVIGAALFLSNAFGRAHDPDVLGMYEWLSRRVLAKESRFPGWSSANNILRALVVHPVYARHAATATLVARVSRFQKGSGQWTRTVPLYQTVNALAHLNSEAAAAQVNRAFRYLTETQHVDGTWGLANREWNTFLVVHALKNKGILE
ncbi:MAG TPA: hypothetical protein PLA74_05480 [Syntrophales bacterium]|nr:hypothetical protein [Syntrophales bacterium]HPQ45176.1 hypothetical protein [Syntrophales bacterium]